MQEILCRNMLGCHVTPSVSSLVFIVCFRSLFTFSLVLALSSCFAIYEFMMEWDVLFVLVSGFPRMCIVRRQHAYPCSGGGVRSFYGPLAPGPKRQDAVEDPLCRRGKQMLPWDACKSMMLDMLSREICATQVTRPLHTCSPLVADLSVACLLCSGGKSCCRIVGGHVLVVGTDWCVLCIS